MKKTNIVVAIIVSIVCIISGIFIFMPNNNAAFESYYKEIKKLRLQILQPHFFMAL